MKCPDFFRKKVIFTSDSYFDKKLMKIVIVTIHPLGLNLKRWEQTDGSFIWVVKLPIHPLNKSKYKFILHVFNNHWLMGLWVGWKRGFLYKLIRYIVNKSLEIKPGDIITWSHVYVFYHLPIHYHKTPCNTWNVLKCNYC